jgi:hypothetical protein
MDNLKRKKILKSAQVTKLQKEEIKTDKIKEYDLTEREEKALKKWTETYTCKFGAPSFIKGPEGQIVPNEKSDEILFIKFSETTGTPDLSLGFKMIELTAKTQYGAELIDQFNFSVKFLNGMNPQNPLEGILISQMAGTYFLSMEFMRRAILKDQYVDEIEANTSRAIRLMSLFTRQMEALEKLRGKTGNQKVTVEHVYVNAGGQAIVGNVEALPGGDKKKEQG